MNSPVPLRKRIKRGLLGLLLVVAGWSAVIWIGWQYVMLWVAWIDVYVR